jgi:alpha-1,6-mannosyltransferase
VLLALLPAAHRLYGPGGFSVVYLIAVALWFPLWRQGRLGRKALLVGALAIRLILLLYPPALSADAWRYLLDARSSLGGINPYEYPPARNPLLTIDPTFASIAAEVNHPEIASIYPPLAQIVFVTSGGSFTVWRITLIVVDLAAILLLTRAKRDRPALGYAFAPLILVETAWNAHLESLVAFMLLLALLKKKRSSFALAAAIGLKITPFVAIPAIARHAGWRLRDALIFLGALALPFALFVHSPLMPGMRDYATRWIFNAPFFESLRAAITAGGIDAGLKAIWTKTKDPWAQQHLSDFVYAALHPDRIARVVLLILLFVALFVIMRLRTNAEGRIAASFTALMLLSPTVHPWYWVAAFPIFLIARHPLPVWMAMLAPASYLLYIEGRRGSIAVAILCYAVPVIAWQVERRFRDASHPRRVAPARLPPSASSS